MVPEAALGQLEAVQARLAQSEQKLQTEIDALREELRKDQDPSRMQLIQEMISVSVHTEAVPLVLIYAYMLCSRHRTSWDKCHEYEKRRPSLRLSYEILQKRFRCLIWQRRTSFSA